jgi:fatty acid desaturase
MLDQLLTTLPLLLTGLVLGGMTFFGFVFAPLVFAKLPADTAGGFIRQVFPVYYRVFAIVCALAALAAWGRLDAAVLALVTAGFLFAWLWLMPRINQARDSAAEDAASGTRFARLHRLSVLINAAQLVAVLIVFVRLAG